MLYLSQEDIEVIGESVLKDCARKCDKAISIPVDIEDFAGSYLGLGILYRKLSGSGSILGLTTYKGVNLALKLDEGDVLLSVPRDTILLDETLSERKAYKRRRFTIAHECAHQILARIEARETSGSLRESLLPGMTYSPRELRTSEDWNEWQANTLAAVLLMPRHELITRINVLFDPILMTIIESKNINALGIVWLKKMADKFGVSKEAMAIRMEKLGYKIKPEFERLIQTEQAVLEIA